MAEKELGVQFYARILAYLVELAGKNTGAEQVKV